jgi:hypothetical protein
MNMFLLIKRRFLWKSLLLYAVLFSTPLFSQNQIATYAGGAGFESFNDVLQLSNGNFIVAGAADNLNWIAPPVPKVTFANPGIINTSGTSKVAFLLEFDATLQNIVKVYHLPIGAAEDFHFIKTTNIAGQPTGDVYVSGSTMQGYFIGKLNNNFVSNAPTGFSWIYNVRATDGNYPKVYQPWDVGGDGKVIYATGESHGYNWSAIYRLNAQGGDDIVNNWRIHWKVGGGEYYGVANNFPGGTSGLLYSGIVFKRDANRCELRSTSQADYDFWQPDGNGGTKKGKWPLDVLFNGPCTPGITGNSSSGPGYTGYGPAPTFTYGPSSIAIDRRNNAMYIGFNAKSVLPGGNPDFEPAVMAMDNTGQLLWWSRLYHEKTPQGALRVSEPDQYIDALAVDYSLPVNTGNLVVGARCHGNNTENFWKGNAVAASPGSTGFQNNFSGNNGNIHISWIGKLALTTGDLKYSTFMAEYTNDTGSLGAAHSDPNLDGWPSPNNGWPNVNTTNLRKNMIKVTSDGSVVVLGKGRRTITTANAYQKMVKPSQGSSAWNEYVRVYSSDLSKPLYSSLIVGQWDPADGSGGDNVNLLGVYKTANGLVVVGKHKGTGAQIPTAGVPSWGKNTFEGESAVLAFLKADNIVNANDSSNLAVLDITDAEANSEENGLSSQVKLTPNPAGARVTISTQQATIKTLVVTSLDGKEILRQRLDAGHNSYEMNITSLTTGIYLINIETFDGKTVTKKLIKN